MACCLPKQHRGRTWGYKPEGERFSALNLGMVSPARLTLTENFLKNLMQAAKTRTVRFRLFVLSNTRPCSSMQAPLRWLVAAEDRFHDREVRGLKCGIRWTGLVDGGYRASIAEADGPVGESP